jgi:hypothetical protein
MIYENSDNNNTMVQTLRTFVNELKPDELVYLLYRNYNLYNKNTSKKQLIKKYELSCPIASI